MKNIFKPADILIPNKEIDLKKWSVVACDQYTSTPEYWNETKKITENVPSSYHIMLPEIYLSDNNNDLILRINNNMKSYLSNGVFDVIEDSFVYIEREISGGSVRKGLVGILDLNEYDFAANSCSKIRATEGTVISRIPPRVKIRENALLEMPHIMVLIDDREKKVIEPISAKTDELNKIYDFDLMQNGGHICGWQIKAKTDVAEEIEKAISYIESKERFDSLYGLPDANPVYYAVGDGNHSLATAKTCFLNKKNQGQFSDGYALVEIVNLHDESLKFEPIHRLVFNVNPAELTEEINKYFKVANISEISSELPPEGSFDLITSSVKLRYKLDKMDHSLSVGCVQIFLDKFLQEHKCGIDYVHGENTVIDNVSDNTVGFILPRPDKNMLFGSVIKDGPLPRKTFSMGHADDKRFYLECRKL